MDSQQNAPPKTKPRYVLPPQAGPNTTKSGAPPPPQVSRPVPLAEQKAQAAAREKSAESETAETQRIFEEGMKFFASGEDEKAMAAFTKADKRGNADATYMLGAMLDNGFGAVGDSQKAWDLYLRAAENGSVPAMRRQGDEYNRSGHGGREDARKWYSKALRAGDRAAADKLEAMDLPPGRSIWANTDDTKWANLSLVFGLTNYYYLFVVYMIWGVNGNGVSGVKELFMCLFGFLIALAGLVFGVVSLRRCPGEARKRKTFGMIVGVLGSLFWGYSLYAVVPYLFSHGRYWVHYGRFQPYDFGVRGLPKLITQTPWLFWSLIGLVLLTILVVLLYLATTFWGRSYANQYGTFNVREMKHGKGIGYLKVAWRAIKLISVTVICAIPLLAVDMTGSWAARAQNDERQLERGITFVEPAGENAAHSFADDFQEGGR